MATRIAGQGSNWIHRATRLAIYARDDHRCLYCWRKGKGAQLSLDHVFPGVDGNESSKLATACVPCNESKGDRPLDAFLARLAEGGVNTGAVRARLVAHLDQPIDRAEGRRLAALESARKARKCAPKRVASRTARPARRLAA